MKSRPPQGPVPSGESQVMADRMSSVFFQASTDRLGLTALWNRSAELRVPHALRKLAWLTVFSIARKSLTSWTDGLQ